MDAIEEATLIGVALLAAQRLEFVLYGIASHLKPEALTDKRLKNINPEIFLRGDPKNLKVTFGQLKIELGDKLFLASAEFDKLVDDRNVLAHSYWRLSRSGIRDAQKIENPEEFLKKFISDCNHWQSIMYGLLAVMMKSVATSSNRLDELKLSEKQLQDLQVYYEHAAKNT